MHFDEVLSECIHPCSKKRRRAQFSIRAELTRLSVCALRMCVRARASDVCAENFSHSTRLFRQQSRASFMLALCLRAVLISSPDTWDWTRMHVLVVMHRRTLNENADSAKIKAAFYTTDIDILRVSSYIVSIYRSISMNRYTPTDYTYDSELDIADGVPHSVRRSSSSRRGTELYFYM